MFQRVYQESAEIPDVEHFLQALSDLNTKHWIHEVPWSVLSRISGFNDACYLRRLAKAVSSSSSLSKDMSRGGVYFSLIWVDSITGFGILGLATSYVFAAMLSHLQQQAVIDKNMSFKMSTIRIVSNLYHDET